MKTIFGWPKNKEKCGFLPFGGREKVNVYKAGKQEETQQTEKVNNSYGKC